MKKILLIITLFMFCFVYAEKAPDEIYSTDYLIRNYNIVAIGNDKNDGITVYQSKDKITNIFGPVMINGKFKNGYYRNEFGQVKYNVDSTDVTSYVSGTISDYVTTSSRVVNDSNAVDYKKLYNTVMSDSKTLLNKSEYEINSSKVEITKPGYYKINNTSLVYEDINKNKIFNNYFLIKKYDRNGVYVFNYYTEASINLPDIMILEEGASKAVPLNEYINTGKYTGNIIFNLPYASEIKFGSILIDDFNAGPGYTFNFGGNIIAPNSKIRYYGETAIVGSIICDNIYYQPYSNGNFIYHYPYSLKQNVFKSDISYSVEPKDYEDDLYKGSYSISYMLKNYSVITLGQKRIDSRSKINDYGNTPGSVKLFHITGQALIAGDLYGDVYEGEKDSFFNSDYQYTCSDFSMNCFKNAPKFDRTVFDLISNEESTSYVKGNYFKKIEDTDLPLTYIQNWDNMANDNMNYYGQINQLIVRKNGYYTGPGNISKVLYDDEYINFKRLYDNIVSEQKSIDAGDVLETSKVLHIKTGGNYTINDLSNVDEIIFDDFDSNKDNLTIITINNADDIIFPKISKDTGAYKGVVTNDYYGKVVATHKYEIDTFLSKDSYYGNIVWNVPNARYIKLAANAPFIGHLIAPNADVETPETQFAGTFIANSIYGAGNTEAHFYPITTVPACDCDEYNNLTLTEKKMYFDYHANKALGGSGSVTQEVVTGNKEAYNKNIQLFDKIVDDCPEGNEIAVDDQKTNINPYTIDLIFIVLLVMLISGITCLVIKKKKCI